MVPRPLRFIYRRHGSAWQSGESLLNMTLKDMRIKKIISKYTYIQLYKLGLAFPRRGAYFASVCPRGPMNQHISAQVAG